MNEKNKILLKIFGAGMGDALTATPSIRKLSNIYSSKISISSKYQSLFENNPYIENNFNLSDIIDESPYQIFSVFEQRSITESNQIRSLRKHHSCCTERSCAYDLGFDLRSDELQLDFFPTNNSRMQLGEKPCLWDVLLPHRIYQAPNRAIFDETQSIHFQDSLLFLSLEILSGWKDLESPLHGQRYYHKDCPADQLGGTIADL